MWSEIWVWILKNKNPEISKQPSEVEVIDGYDAARNFKKDKFK